MVTSEWGMRGNSRASDGMSGWFRQGGKHCSWSQLVLASLILAISGVVAGMG
jgi:hypothetical protein